MVPHSYQSKQLFINPATINLKILPRNLRLFLLLIILFLSINQIIAQPKSKQVTNHPQTWVGINSVLRFTSHWGIAVDVNYRSNQFFASDFYSIARAGVNYWVNENITFTAGYAHQCTAPTTSGWHTIVTENRLYQQVIIAAKVGRISFTNRLRNEERWQEKIVADTNTHEKIFTDRVRYQLMAILPLTKKSYLPSLVLSDELCVQMGKTIVYNIFDQNRAFIGLREGLFKSLSIDVGYMIIDQEKSSGYQYDRDHIFRLFFHYNPDFRKGK